MFNFTEFLTEGGNVVIDNKEAQRIDLKKIDRSKIVPVLKHSLILINRAFKTQHKEYLWNLKLFQSNKFLSGSAFHFFNTHGIADNIFSTVKPTVGDIDTQVDKTQESSIKQFLDNNKGKTFGDLTLVGYKVSPGQYISLWSSDQFNINIQIDLELVEYENKEPSSWSQFAHSSSWDDLRAGIKGVAHKYLLRALGAKDVQEVYLKNNNPRGKDKIKKSATKTFSVMYGLRDKLKPVLQGNQQAEIEGKKVYLELPPKNSYSTTDLIKIGEYFFSTRLGGVEVKQMESFVGLIHLCNRYLNNEVRLKIFEIFLDIMFGKGAQGLYRADPKRDRQEKMTIVLLLASHFNIEMKPYEPKINEYYKNYR